MHSLRKRKYTKTGHLNIQSLNKTREFRDKKCCDQGKLGEWEITVTKKERLDSWVKCC